MHGRALKRRMGKKYQYFVHLIAAFVDGQILLLNRTASYNAFFTPQSFINAANALLFFYL